MTSPRTALIFILLIQILQACASSTGKGLLAQQKRIADFNERALDSADRGDFTSAELFLEEALRLSSSLDDQEGRSLSLLNMARLARRNNNNELAGKYADMALKAASAPFMLSDVMQEKSIQALKSGDIKAARTWVDMAITNEPGPLMGRRLNLLARIEFVSGNRDDCLKYLKKALSLNSTTGLQEEHANSLRLMGILSTERKNLKDAEQELNQALSIDKELALPPKISEDLKALSNLYKTAGDAAKAESFMERAITVMTNSKSDRQDERKPVQNSFERQQ